MTPPWLKGSYADQLPERVLQFGTGMLLRALSARAVDVANRAGAFNGRVVVVQSTPDGVAAAINRQEGNFTLVELGVEHGDQIRRAVIVHSISRALVASTEWALVRDVIAASDLRVVVSNVTEAGFRLDDDEPPVDPRRTEAPHSFPAKVTDLLYHRFSSLPGGPSLVVIPTELVDDNGRRLAAMVDTLAAAAPDSEAFRGWIQRQVKFCSSLPDRITTGAPSPELRAKLQPQVGYSDELITIAEPHSFWAIEGDPAALREAFPVDEASGGAVVFAPDISFYRDRKLRMLNGLHTVIAPLALKLGVATVDQATSHPTLGPLMEHVLLQEIVPTISARMPDAEGYARSVLDRFSNPWLGHRWQVIAANQTAKFRLRVVPSIVDYSGRFGAAPRGLSVALAATLAIGRRVAPDGAQGWWSIDGGHIVDVDRDLIDRHWRCVISPSEVPGTAELADVAASALSDPVIWGTDLGILPGLVDAVTRALATFQPMST